MLSPGFYYSDTDAGTFLVEQTFSPTQPYTMNTLFPFNLICKWPEVSMQCPQATNLVIITPEMSTVLCVGWNLSSRSVHSKDFQKECQPSLTAGEDEAQREKMSCPSLRRTRHHAQDSDSTPPRPVVGRDDSIRFTLSALINRRQGTTDPELNCVPWTERENSLPGTAGLIPGYRIPEALCSSPWTAWAGPARTILAADEQRMVGALDLPPLKTPIPQPCFSSEQLVSPFPSAVSPLPFHLLRFYFSSQVLLFSCFPFLRGLLQVACFSLLLLCLALL